MKCSTKTITQPAHLQTVSTANTIKQSYGIQFYFHFFDDSIQSLILKTFMTKVLVFANYTYGKASITSRKFSALTKQSTFWNECRSFIAIFLFHFGKFLKIHFASKLKLEKVWELNANRDANEELLSTNARRKLKKISQYWITHNWMSWLCPLHLCFHSLSFNIYGSLWLVNFKWTLSAISDIFLHRNLMLLRSG